ncbi:MAG TPA: 3-phosphoshikimate 1-carboxyvinyltransferase, partial [Alteromonas australica]|nr:3-phosphoshikimate 1-carboxyvinyltransferase [Alteromonas australica]
VFLLVSILLGLIVLYLIKSALGINLIDGWSLGLWGWFKENVIN